MEHFGGLIWVAIVLFGVISSITKNARKARKTTASQRVQAQASGTRAQAPASGQAMPARSVRQAMPAPHGRQAMPPPAVAASPGVTAGSRVIRTYIEASPSAIERVAEAFVTETPTLRRSQRGVRGMFRDKRSFMRGIVAAEVLGQPAALRESTLWSPRHSEPST